VPRGEGGGGSTRRPGAVRKGEFPVSGGGPRGRKSPQPRIATRASSENQTIQFWKADLDHFRKAIVPIVSNGCKRKGPLGRDQRLKASLVYLSRVDSTSIRLKARKTVKKIEPERGEGGTTKVGGDGPASENSSRIQCSPIDGNAEAAPQCSGQQRPVQSSHELPSTHNKLR